MPIESKQLLINKLTESAERLKRVRDRAALIKSQLNHSEPNVIQTAQSTIPTQSIVKGQG